MSLSEKLKKLPSQVVKWAWLLVVEYYKPIIAGLFLTGIIIVWRSLFGTTLRILRTPLLKLPTLELAIVLTILTTLALSLVLLGYWIRDKKKKTIQQVATPPTTPIRYEFIEFRGLKWKVFFPDINVEYTPYCPEHQARIYHENSVGYLCPVCGDKFTSQLVRPSMDGMHQGAQSLAEATFRKHIVSPKSN
jgi:hypothetical protein